MGGGARPRQVDLAKSRDTQAGGKQAYRHLNWRSGRDPSPWRDSDLGRTWRRGSHLEPFKEDR